MGKWKRELSVVDAKVPIFLLLLEYAKEWLIENPANPFKPAVIDDQDYETDEDDDADDDHTANGTFRLPTDLDGRLRWKK